MKNTVTALAVTAALLLTGCQPSSDQGGSAAPADDQPATPAAEETTATPTEPAAGGLATFDTTSDFPQAIVESQTHSGFDYDGLHIKLTAAEIMPVDEVTVEQFYEDFEDFTPIRYTFDLVNTTSEPFPLEEFYNTAYSGENYYELESEAGIMDGEPVTEPLPRRVAGNNEAQLIVTYKVPDEDLDEPVLIEISPGYEGPVVEYFVDPDDVTEWEG